MTKYPIIILPNLIIASMLFLTCEREKDRTEKKTTAEFSAEVTFHDNQRGVWARSVSSSELNSRLVFEDCRVCFVDDGFIWTAASDNTSRKKFVQGERPRLSPTGDMILYEDIRGGISILRLDSGCPIQLANTGTKPVWSPDGVRLCYLEGDRLVVMNIDGTSKRFLSMATQKGSDPMWFPDGTQILYNHYPFNGPGEVCKVNVASGEISKIGIGERPALSPDGKKYAAILRFRSVGSSTIREKLFVVDMELNQEIALYEMIVEGDDEIIYTPVWSPRGDEIVFVRAKWVVDGIEKLTKDIMIADLNADTVGTFIRCLEIPVDLGQDQLGRGVPYDVWGVSWSPSGHDLILSLIEPMMIFAGEVEGIDKDVFMIPGLKGLRPRSRTETHGIEQDKILVVQRKSGLNGALIMYGGHGVFVQGGVNWYFL